MIAVRSAKSCNLRDHLLSHVRLNLIVIHIQGRHNVDLLLLLLAHPEHPTNELIIGDDSLQSFGKSDLGASRGLTDWKISS